VILELEIHVENFQPRNVAGNQTHLGRMLQRLQAATTLQALYDISVKEIQAMTGYDRVLIYRFEEEGHGQVIAEASIRRWKCSTACSSRLRTSPSKRASCTAPTGCGSSQCRLSASAAGAQAAPGHPDPLDLSFATLRSVSPIHCQYMQNMGVLSSMSISLLKGDKLWGLISCGNREPLHVPHELRSACQTIGQVLSLQISAMEALELSRQREEKVEALALLNQAMIDSPQNVFDGLAQQPQVLMALTGAGGVAIIEDKQLHRYGNCPEPEDIRALHKWLQETGEPVFASHHLASVYPPAAQFQQVASGVLAMSLPKPVDNGVLWFRPEVKENINWSGDPRKPLDLENSDAGLRLRPRTSFEIWKVEMAGISTKWSHGDLFAANDLRRSALENDLARQVHREQEAVRARMSWWRWFPTTCAIR
jgi:light-regulated signal transduction histidine kinase (bacteriophytochrome)